MIIAISGKIGSGKDTVGRILQMLIANPTRSTSGIVETLKEYEDSTEQFPDLSTWENRKFADKLKDIVCILLGCTREQLEDREFKEKELGEEWWYYKIYESQVKGFVLYPYLENKDKYHIIALVKLTPRLLLQLLGTECGRQIIHPNIWVNALMREYKPSQLLISKIRRKSFGISPQKLEESLPNWIITDMRFPNELKAVKDKGGITIRVNRPCFICGILDGHQKGCQRITDPILKEPESETALDDYTDWDYIIENKGSLEELVEKVREILKKCYRDLF